MHDVEDLSVIIRLQNIRIANAPDLIKIDFEVRVGAYKVSIGGDNDLLSTDFSKRQKEIGIFEDRHAEDGRYFGLSIIDDDDGRWRTPRLRSATRSHAATPEEFEIPGD